MLGLRRYSTPVDLWSIGAIFYEMAHRKALFMGDSEIDQLFKIFQIMGTPSETLWPGVSALPEYKLSFPKWLPMKLSDLCPNFDAKGLDLLTQMIQLDPTKRISARDALLHVFLY